MAMLSAMDVFSQSTGRIIPYISERFDVKLDSRCTTTAYFQTLACQVVFVSDPILDPSTGRYGKVFVFREAANVEPWLEFREVSSNLAHRKGHEVAILDTWNWCIDSYRHWKGSNMFGQKQTDCKFPDLFNKNPINPSSNPNFWGLDLFFTT